MKKGNGFTIIEALILLCILGILFAIGLPLIKRSQAAKGRELVEDRRCYEVHRGSTNMREISCPRQE